MNWLSIELHHCLKNTRDLKKKQQQRLSFIQVFQYEMDKMTLGNTFFSILNKRNTGGYKTRQHKATNIEMVLMLSLFLIHTQSSDWEDERKYKFWQTCWHPQKQWTPSWLVNNTPHDHVKSLPANERLKWKVRKFSYKGRTNNHFSSCDFTVLQIPLKSFLTPSLISKKMTEREMKQLLILENGQSQRAMGES